MDLVSAETVEQMVPVSKAGQPDLTSMKDSH